MTTKCKYLVSTVMCEVMLILIVIEYLLNVEGLRAILTMCTLIIIFGIHLYYMQKVEEEDTLYSKYIIIVGWLLLLSLLVVITVLNP